MPLFGVMHAIDTTLLNHSTRFRRFLVGSRSPAPTERTWRVDANLPRRLLLRPEGGAVASQHLTDNVRLRQRLYLKNRITCRHEPEFGCDVFASPSKNWQS